MVYLCKHTFSKCVKRNLVNAEQNKVQLQQRRNYDRTQSIQSKYYYIAGQIWPTILSLTSELLRHPACIEAGDRKTIVRFIDLLIIVPGLCRSLKFKVSKNPTESSPRQKESEGVRLEHRAGDQRATWRQWWQRPNKDRVGEGLNKPRAPGETDEQSSTENRWVWWHWLPWRDRHSWHRTWRKSSEMIINRRRL